MRATWPICYARECCARSITENMACERCASWRAVIRPSAKNLNRVMNRIKALYRGRSIPCAGTQVYAPRYRQEWLHKIEHAGVRRRAELLCQQFYNTNLSCCAENIDSTGLPEGK